MHQVNNLRTFINFYYSDDRASCGCQKICDSAAELFTEIYLSIFLPNQLQHQSKYDLILTQAPHWSVCSVTLWQLVVSWAKWSSDFLSEDFKCCFTLHSPIWLQTDYRLQIALCCLLVFWRLKAITECIHSSHFSSSAVK